MMKKNVFYSFLVLFALISFGSWVLYPSGSPGGRTGSPGDNGQTCTTCHSGTAQTASGWITSDIPAAGYLPGETYTITATGTHSGVARFGFEATAENLAGAKAGTMIITDAAQTRLVNSNKAVTHTSNGTTPSGSTKSWSFDWTAPEAGSGDIAFYAAFNAANGNGSTSGDVIYVSSAAFAENTGVGVAEDLVTAARLKMFPNPATDHAYITWNAASHPVKAIKVFNLAGAQAASYIIEGPQVDRFRIATPELAPGMYIVQTVFADGRQASIYLVKR